MNNGNCRLWNDIGGEPKTIWLESSWHTIWSITKILIIPLVSYPYLLRALHSTEQQSMRINNPKIVKNILFISTETLYSSSPFNRNSIEWTQNWLEKQSNYNRTVQSMAQSSHQSFLLTITTIKFFKIIFNLQ